MMHSQFLFYLLLINITSALFFAYDKWAAINKHRRVSEKFLHTIELLGGVFSICILIFLVHHKNKKASYWLWTFIILFVWIGLGYLLFQNNH